MLIITRLNHHYSARRFIRGGPIWVLDSLFEQPVKDSKSANEKLLFFLKENFDMRTIVTRVFTTQNTIHYDEILFIESNNELEKNWFERSGQTSLIKNFTNRTQKFRSVSEKKQKEQDANTKRRAAIRLDEELKQKEQDENTKLRAAKRLDEEIKQKEQDADTNRRAAKRLEEIKQKEQDADTNRRAAKRLDEEIKQKEQDENTKLRAAKRLDEEIKQKEQDADTNRRAAKRLDEEIKQKEQDADTNRRAAKRLDEEIKQKEQDENTKLRAAKRLDEEIKQKEQDEDTKRRAAKRLDEEIKQKEQVKNTKNRTKSRLDDETKKRDLDILNQSRISKKNAQEILDKNTFENIPVYFESQSEHLCGKHALNNLVQYNMFDVENLVKVAKDLKANQMIQYPKDNIIYYTEYPRGNFTTHVIEKALIDKGFETTILNRAQLELQINNRQPIMLIITHLKHHFSARRFEENGDLWIFDSFAKRPVKDKETFSMFDLLIEHLDYGGDNIPLVEKIIPNKTCESLVFSSYYKSVQSTSRKQTNPYQMTFQKLLPEKTSKNVNKLSNDEVTMDLDPEEPILTNEITPEFIEIIDEQTKQIEVIKIKKSIKSFKLLK
jgi:hypothetical protein